MIGRQTVGGDVALDGYEHVVVIANATGRLDQRRADRDDHVEAARIVEDVHPQDVRIVPQHRDAGDEVGYDHAGQDDVGLGPESRRVADGYQREAVTAQVDYGQSKENGDHHQKWNRCKHMLSPSFSAGRSHGDVVVAGGDVDIRRL